MQAISNPAPPRLKVVLVTSFAESFLEKDTIPELERRGIEVFARFEAKRAKEYDFDRFVRGGVSLILHMVEVGGHIASETLSRLAREAGIPIKALSRKKASWSFLPPPLDGGPPSAKPEAALPYTPAVEKRRGLGSHLGTVNAASGAAAAYDAKLEERALTTLAEGYLHASPESTDVPVPPHIQKYLRDTRFDRKQARLRDVVQLVLGHGITAPERVLAAVLAGREQGTFPRLVRVKREDIPKLVSSILEQETSQPPRVVHLTLDPDDRERYAAMGLTEPNIVPPETALELEKELMNSAKVVPMMKPSENTTDEVACLRARVAELEKLEKAHAALKTLVGLGMMSAVEAAEKLFGESRS